MTRQIALWHKSLVPLSPKTTKTGSFYCHPALAGSPFPILWVTRYAIAQSRPQKAFKQPSLNPTATTTALPNAKNIPSVR